MDLKYAKALFKTYHKYWRVNENDVQLEDSLVWKGFKSALMITGLLKPNDKGIFKNTERCAMCGYLSFNPNCPYCMQERYLPKEV